MPKQKYHFDTEVFADLSNLGIPYQDIARKMGYVTDKGNVSHKAFYNALDKAKKEKKIKLVKSMWAEKSEDDNIFIITYKGKKIKVEFDSNEDIKSINM